jgi:hypothetical protein
MSVHPTTKAVTCNPYIPQLEVLELLSFSKFSIIWQDLPENHAALPGKCA